MIEIKDLTFKYSKQKTIVDNVTYKFEDNMIYGIIGKNGIGKTTLLQCLDGTNKIEFGQLIIDGKDCTKLNFLNNPLVILNNEKVFYNNLTVNEHLLILKRYHKSLDISNVVKQFHLCEYLDSYPSQLSLGTAHRLNLALRITGQTKNIVADEPFNSLDPFEAESLCQQFKKMKSNQGTIIISSHDIQSLFNLCDVILHLDQGKLKEVKQDVKTIDFKKSQ